MYTDKTFICDKNKLKFIELPLDELFSLQINHNRVKYEFLIRFSSVNKNLICFGSGDYDPKKNSPPIYRRHSWHNEFEESIIYYNDPTIYNDPDLTLAWGVGKNEEWYLLVLADIIRILALKNHISPKNILFFGSSGGGFTAIILSTLIKNSSAIVNNPQIFLNSYYWKIRFGYMIETCFNDLDRETILTQYKHRFDVVEVFKRENHVPQITYIVNVKSKEDISTQFIHFIKNLVSFEKFNNNQINIFLYSNEQGHGGVLGKKETINLIKKHFKNVAQLPIHYQFYVPEKETNLDDYLFKQLKTVQNSHMNETVNLEIINSKKPFKISIILPVFNVQDYIEEALESILKQSIDHELEVIMVDDCSTDQSGKIIDEYSSKYENFKAIHLPKNSGNAGKPRNVGIDNATSEYLMFLDPDDFYADNTCETLYNKIVEKNVDLVFCNFSLYYPNGNLVKSYLPSFGNTDEIKLKTIDDDPRLLDAFRIWTIILKKSFIVNNDIRFSEDTLAEDRAFLLETFLKAKGIIYLQNYLGTNYRVRSSSDKVSLSNATTKKALMDRVDGYIHTYNILKRHKKEEFVPYALNVREFWIDRFIKSDLNSAEKKDLLRKIAFLFKEYEKFESIVYKKYLIPLFDLIAKKRFNEAVSLSNIIKDFTNTQELLQKEKDRAIGERDFYIGEKNKAIGERDFYIREKNKAIGERDFYIRKKNKVEKLVKAYRSRKIVRIVDKFLEISYSNKSYFKSFFKEKSPDIHSEKLSSELKNKESKVEGFKEVKENFSNFSYLQKKIEMLEDQKDSLEKIVEAYRSRKIVKIADKLFKEKSPDIHSANTIELGQPDIDCADYSLTIMKSKFLDRELSKNGLKKLNDIKIAVIFDEFSYNCFKYEFNAIPIEPSNWLEIFEKEKPDLFLCESAWHGIDKDRQPWEGKICVYDNYDDRGVLFDIIRYCNEHGILSIFWNKEDPTDFSKFFDTALKFDHIFTSAVECVEMYKKYGHESVHCLMFAGQPKLFNPIWNRQRSTDIVFAGSWYNRFPQRCNEMEEIFNNILDSGLNLKIYDRFYHSKFPAFKFPDKYTEFINPPVPFDEVEKVYKESKYALSINTITESNSMFSRRAFELMLSNTLVLSNYSKAMHRIFGDNVIFTGNDKIDLIDSDEKRINNLYNVLKSHTYYNRFKKILNTINYPYIPNDQSIAIYYVVNSRSEIKDVFKHYDAINYNSKKLVILLSDQIPDHIIDPIHQNYTNDEVSFYSLKDLLNQKEVISNDTNYFVFADMKLKEDFVEKAILHYSYIERKFGIALGDKFTFKTFYDINNVILPNEHLEDAFKKTFKNNSGDFSVYTIPI